VKIIVRLQDEEDECQQRRVFDYVGLDVVGDVRDEDKLANRRYLCA
jgi:hypothetical protein